MLERHIFIIGMPGSGKSSLGRKVAANLRLGYVDTDRKIAELVGISIPEIFKKYGEEKFRVAEKNLLIRSSWTAARPSTRAGWRRSSASTTSATTPTTPPPT